ncbi:hypothetical protein D3C81_2007470 [compost metagenome]
MCTAWPRSSAALFQSLRKEFGETTVFRVPFSIQLILTLVEPSSMANFLQVWVMENVSIVLKKGAASEHSLVS